MIEKFDEVKKQLSELSHVINSFKSEAVQLRIVELIFLGRTRDEVPPVEEEIEESANVRRRSTRSRRKKAGATPRNDTAEAKSPKARSSGKQGALGILNRLIEDGFFSQKRTLSEIVNHCDTKLATKFKQNDISGKVVRLVRNGQLTRTKNSDGQYEYVKK